ncbi:MAG: ATP-binding protein [Coriobacteriales bacterium]|nr:ATP-binding protein [Coriobacteriales bacterium]
MVLDALLRARVVELLGSRQVGKSTLAKAIGESQSATYVSLDDGFLLEAARTDPKAFLRQGADGLLIIDEVQKAPGLIPEIKLLVDSDNRPGQFLLTGSANLLELDMVDESLAGRAEVIDLYGFSQEETHGTHSDFLATVFESSAGHGYRSGLSKDDYVGLIEKGSYPEATARNDDDRPKWFKNYLRLISNRDAKDISELRRLADLPRILRYLASLIGSELVVSNASRDLGIPNSTLRPYIALLDTLYLVHALEPWSRNLTSPVIKNRKAYLLDSGLASYLTRARPDHGALFEDFVIGEILKQNAYKDLEYSLSFFRDYDKNEVDLILQNEREEIAACEVKFTATPAMGHLKVLRKLEARYPEQFKCGVVFYAGTETVRFSEKICFVPADVLWAGTSAADPADPKGPRAARQDVP